MKTLQITIRGLVTMLCLLSTALIHATTVLPLNLAQISEQAESAFVVKIESTQTQTSGTRSYDLIQGTVIEPVFGNVRTSQPISWKQFRFAKDRPMMGMPTYKEGQEYLIFLSGPASRTGFQIPMGLEQGAFDVVRNPKNGTTRVKNNSGNAWLTRNLNVEKLTSDLASREVRTRGLNPTAKRERAAELKQRLRPTRAGNSLDVIKEAARLFHEKKTRGLKASQEYLTTGTAVQVKPILAH